MSPSEASVSADSGFGKISGVRQHACFAWLGKLDVLPFVVSLREAVDMTLAGQ